MKKLTLLSIAVFVSMLFSSCCSSGGCGGSALTSLFSSKKVNTSNCGACEQKQRFVKVGCENIEYTTKQVTKYKKVKRTVYPGTKNGTPYEVEELQPYYETVRVPVGCTTCGSTYCPAPNCCGTISNAVIKRATGQGGTGEPHIGQIPTMKRLIE